MALALDRDAVPGLCVVVKPSFLIPRGGYRSRFLSRPFISWTASRAFLPSIPAIAPMTHPTVGVANIRAHQYQDSTQSEELPSHQVIAPKITEGISHIFVLVPMLMLSFAVCGLSV